MGTKQRKQKEKAERKHEILAAAEKRFIEKGYENAIMDQIAKDCDLSKGTIYLYFKNKDQLYFAVVERKIAEFITHVVEHIQDTKNTRADERLVKIASICFEFIKQHPEAKPLIRNVHSNFLKQTSAAEEAHERFHKKIAIIPELIAEILNQGIQNHVFRVLNINLVSQAFWWVINGMIFSWVYEKYQKKDEEIVFFQAVRCFIDGLYENPKLQLFT